MRATSARVHPLRFGDLEGTGLARVSARRSGRRPLLLVGRVLLEARSAMGHALSADTPVRHVITIVELSEGGFGYALEQWVHGCDVPYAEAGTRDTLPEVASDLRAFDAAQHLSADISADSDPAQAFERISSMRTYALSDYTQTLAHIIKSQ